MKFARTKYFWIILGLAIVGVAGVCLFRNQATKGSPGESPEGKTRTMRTVTPQVATTNQSQKVTAKKRRRMADPLEDLSPTDRALYTAVQDALDAEDLEKTKLAAEEAYKSMNPDVRLQAVEALGWFGPKGLAELTPMMADANEDVAQAATDAWELGLADIEDADSRFAISQMALTSIRNSQSLVTIGAQFVAAATDLIDGTPDEEKALNYRVQAVQTIVDMLDGAGENSSRADVTKDIYEDLTGHVWQGINEAERYLQDPENYEPPEEGEASER